eukprot:scaffold73890_cov61-Phaeocystis_antarctica.AAC.4
MNVPTSFWQYSESLRWFLSSHVSHLMQALWHVTTDSSHWSSHCHLFTQFIRHGGGGGGDGGWICTTKDLVPWLPSAKRKPCPKPGAAHSAPFQPSPYESVMSRVHVAPSATTNGMLEAYGAPPLSVVSSEQLRLQPISL